MSREDRWSTGVLASAVARLPGTLESRGVHGDDPLTRFRARPADRPGWWVRALGLAGGTAAVVLGVALVPVGHPVAGGVVATLCSVGTLWVYRVGRPRSFAITEAGIVCDGRLRPWDRLVAYGADDEVVVVRGEGRFDDLRIDREDLDDADDVVGILADRLPEAD